MNDNIANELREKHDGRDIFERFEEAPAEVRDSEFGDVVYEDDRFTAIEFGSERYILEEVEADREDQTFRSRYIRDGSGDVQYLLEEENDGVTYDMTFEAPTHGGLPIDDKESFNKWWDRFSGKPIEEDVMEGHDYSVQRDSPYDQ